MTTILLFGKLQDLTENYESELEIPASLGTVRDLREHVDGSLKLGGALLAENVRVAINGEVMFDTDNYLGANEIAFLPPVGGG